AWVEWQVRHVLEHAGRRERPVPMSDLPEQADDEAIDEAEVRTLVNDLLTQLHPDERQLLQMHMEGYSAGEIAKEMGLSRDTVYQRMHRTMMKARRILLMLFLLLVTSSITVAVVPQWRRKVFGIGKQDADSVQQAVEGEPTPYSPALSSVIDSTGDSVSQHRAWVPSEPIPHLVAVADTEFTPLPPPLSEPCGCPEGYRLKKEVDSLDLLDDPCEPLPDDLPEASIWVVGTTIVVEGVMNELVDVFDIRGRLVATAHCNGRCSIPLRLEHDYSRSRSDTHIFWVHVGNRPRHRVTIVYSLQPEWNAVRRVFHY
ncbi:MAG: sigma-70 family RNA polymerase sigma factor, partial [Bacteroidales bacterium]|nr:sigma-70 family RNA polymerase sigma factor [Bacteroidales bacterium]